MFRIISILGGIGTAVQFVIRKFFPFIIKKFGLGAVKFSIQKSASIAVVLVTVAFYGSVIIFISETYTMFHFIIDKINNPMNGMGGEAASKFSCFLYLFAASGIKSGFTSAFSFFVSVMIFFFTRGLYSLTQKSLKIVSDEISKSTKLI